MRMLAPSTDPKDLSVATNTPAATATLANVADAATVQTLAAANSARMGLIIFNDSTSDLYLKYGSAASLTSFTYKVFAGSTWEMPIAPCFTGIVTGIWSADASGSARVTELTA